MPAPLRAPGEAGNHLFCLSVVVFLIVEPIANHDLTELFVARQQLIQWFDLPQRVRLQRSTHVFVDKRFKPISQGARLRRNGIELTRNGALSQSIRHALGDQPSLLDPSQQVVPRGKPFDLGIHRDRDGVQEVQSQVVGDEKRRRAPGRHGSFAARHHVHVHDR